jgi:putative membrane protein
MDTRSEELPVPELRDYLAQERTLLAWIRTGIALIGLGLLVARFGVFGDPPHTTPYPFGLQPHELSFWFGALLIAAGVIVNLFCAQRYMRLTGELNRRPFVHRSLSSQGVIVAMFLALIGIAMTISMIPVLA